MKFLSVCSGIEAASAAWNSLGWKAAAFSEIEKFPCQVLAHHYPDTPNLGDMNKYEQWPELSIDLLCGGTPCQSFSVAGLRKGLDDARGNLMLTFAAIAAKYRPKWLVWENVPGVLSSNGGRDFASFLGLLSGQIIAPPAEGWANSGIITGYKNAYSLAYRVLDAQYFGGAQRRRRVFVVGCLGANRSAAAVLFERQSLSGDTAPSREKSQSLAGTITSSPFNGGAGGKPDVAQVNHFIPTVASGKPTIGCLMANAGTKLWLGNQEALTGDYHILHQVFAFDTTNITSPTNRSNPHPGDPVHTLAKGQHAPAIAYGIPGNWIGRKPENGGNAVEPMHNVAPCLTKVDQHGVCAPTLTSNGDAHSGFRDEHGLVTQQMQVRRLTPTECERLQGFPDGWTNIPVKGKPAADGPRYKALGNSWAVPVVQWIGKRIEAVDAILTA